MVEKLGIEPGKIDPLCNLLYKNYGTTMAGLRVIILFGLMIQISIFNRFWIRNCGLNLRIYRVFFRQSDTTSIMTSTTGSEQTHDLKSCSFIYMLIGFLIGNSCVSVLFMGDCRMRI